MHIDGAVYNMNRTERKYLMERLDLMYSECVDSVKVSDVNTTNTSDAMDDMGDENFPI